MGIVQKISVILLPKFDVEDSFCWGFIGSCQFSTKMATWADHNNHISDYTMPKDKLRLTCHYMSHFFL